MSILRKIRMSDTFAVADVPLDTYRKQIIRRVAASTALFLSRKSSTASLLFNQRSCIVESIYTV